MIDKRPSEWNGGSPGDFEMDTIVGKDGKGAVVTIVERNTSFTMARNLPQQSSSPNGYINAASVYR